MPDPIFENPCLAKIFDALDGNRGDLDHYISIAKELKARSILDIGSGTGCFAILASRQGFEVTGLEPAKASMDVAVQKPHADKVRWILGDSTCLTDLGMDLAVMTGNVAQVFLEDHEWESNLIAIRKALNPKGHLVFEVRDPARKAWLEWNREKTYRRVNIPGIGNVEEWCDLISVSAELVSFRWTYVFEEHGETIESDSTIRFRGREDIERSLTKCGYAVSEIRDAPDRPQKEFVFISTPI